MKYQSVFFFIVFVLLASCGPSAEEKARIEKCIADQIAAKLAVEATLKNSFDSPFPKRNRNLRRILGDTLQIEGRCIPQSFRIVSTKKLNYIIDIDWHDTLFKGTVCKYRGLYYLNEKINDTTYRIFALKITDSLIYGLQNYLQYAQIDSAIEQGKYPALVKYINKDKKVIRLHPDKRELKGLFASIIANTEPFEIIRANPVSKSTYEENLNNSIDGDDFDVLSKVYPNPAIDILNVELQQKNVAIPYYLNDITGKVLAQGKFQEISNTIDVGHLAKGVYTLTIITPELEKESVKIIKAK